LGGKWYFCSGREWLLRHPTYHAAVALETCVVGLAEHSDRASSGFWLSQKLILIGD